MRKNKTVIIGTGIFVGVIIIFVIAAFMMNSRSIVIHDQSHTSDPEQTTTASSTAGSDSGSLISSNIAINDNPNPQEVADFSVNISSTYAFSTAPIDDATYDTDMLTLANLTPSRTVTMKVGSTTITKTIPASPAGWPVKTAPYPITGALLPYNRIVAYYGNLYSKQMGVLGQYPQAQMLAMLASTTAMWQAADPSTPVIPALDYIVVTAQGSAGADGKYRDRMPESQVDEILTMANEIHGIVFLDVQVGLSNVETEVPLLAPYLKLPNVELALDPEFDMHNGEKPGTVIGTMDASDINWAANYLAGLVKQYNLPPKILVVHRFTQDMVTNTSEIKPLPEVQVVMDMDGFGFPAKKINTYEQVIVPNPVQFTGFKLFYHNDTLGPNGALMTPEEVLKLSPRPSYIQYQ